MIFLCSENSKRFSETYNRANSTGGTSLTRLSGLTLSWRTDISAPVSLTLLAQFLAKCVNFCSSVNSQQVPWIQGIPWLRAVLWVQRGQQVQGVHLVQGYPKYNHMTGEYKMKYSSIAITLLSDCGILAASLLLFSWTYRRSSFAIGSRASRATSHTLRRKGCIWWLLAVFLCVLAAVVSTQKNCHLMNTLQNSPWIQERQEHRGFLTHQWLPEVPLRQWHHALRGHPIEQVERGQEKYPVPIISNPYGLNGDGNKQTHWLTLPPAAPSAPGKPRAPGPP